MQALAQGKNMATCSEYVAQQLRIAKIVAIKERILTWFEQIEAGHAALVDLIELPDMKREGCDNLAPYVPTGKVDVVLKLEGVVGVKAKIINPNLPKSDATNWTVE